MNGEVTAWQRRPLAPMDPVVFLDALRVKTRDEATVRSTAVHPAVAVFPDGTRDTVERSPWGAALPRVVASWRRAWTPVIPVFAFPPEVRRVIDTTNALARVHA
jgi:transposase-like protein